MAIAKGDAVAKGTPITISEGAIVRDELGKARGGVRTPAVDAPTLSLSGKGSPNSPVCALLGSRALLTDGQLAQRYQDHKAYVDAVVRSADDAVTNHFLLGPDARALIRDAKQADVP